MNNFQRWLSAKTIIAASILAAVLFALWVWLARPPRIYTDWLGLVGRVEEAPLQRIRAWTSEANAPRTPSGFISLFETDETVVGGLLLAVSILLVVLLAVPRSGPWWQLLSTSPFRALRALPTRFRVHTLLVAIATLAVWMGWEIESWKTWRLRQAHLRNATYAASRARRQRFELELKQEELAKLNAPLTDHSDPAQGYYRSKAAVAAERAMARDRLNRESRELSTIVMAYEAQRLKYERAVTNPRASVEPDSPIPQVPHELPPWSYAFSSAQKRDYVTALEALDVLTWNYPDFVDAYELAATIRATCPEARFRDGKLAITSATRACELTDWKDVEALSHLAAAYAEAGDFAAAVKWRQEAVKRSGNNPNAKIYRDHLDRYLSGKPCRQE